MSQVALMMNCGKQIKNATTSLYESVLKQKHTNENEKLAMTIIKTQVFVFFFLLGT